MDDRRDELGGIDFQAGAAKTRNMFDGIFYLLMRSVSV